jgi:hypothetical protein
MAVTENRESPLGHYDNVLCEARPKAELIANKYIFELHTILRDEEHLAIEATEEDFGLVPKISASIIVINKLTVEKQEVLNPFMGPRMFCKAASRLKRRFIGIGIDPQRFDLAKTNLKMKIREGLREINE